MDRPDKLSLRDRASAFRRKLPRGVVSDVYETAGAGCLVAAAWWWEPLIGLVSLGVAFLVAGWVTHVED